MYFSPIGGHPPVCGVVQIAHGLSEHMSRYVELAETLVRENLSLTEMITGAMV